MRISRLRRASFAANALRRKSSARWRMDLETGNNFVEVAHDFGFVGVLDAGVEIGIGASNDLEEKFVASSARKAGVIAVEISRAHSGGASLPPVKGDALNGC